MKWPKLALLLFAALPCCAQSYVTITDTAVTIKGTALAAGQMCWLGTDPTDTPIAYTPAGGPTINSAQCANISTGVLSFLQVANPATANPTTLQYRVTILDNLGNVLFSAPHIVPSGSVFAFNAYALAGSAAGVGSPLQYPCGTGATYQQTDATNTVWNCTANTWTPVIGGGTALGYFDWLQIATPSSGPASGYLRAYAKQGTNQLCTLNAALTETCFGTGSGGSGGSNAQTWTKYTESYNSVTSGGSSKTLTLFPLGARQELCNASIFVTTPFAGATGVTITLGDTNGTTSSYTAIPTNAMLASPQHYTIYGSIPPGNGVVTVTFTAASGNLSALYAGSVDVDVCTETVP